MQQLAEFEVLYPEIKAPVFEYLLTGIGKDTLSRVTTYLIGNDLYARKEVDNKKVIENWFSTGNKTFAQQAYDKLEHYQDKSGKKVKVVSVISCLNILQFGLELEEKGLLDKKSKEQSEIDLYFAMLIFNQNMDYNQTKDKEKVKQLFPGNEAAALMLNYSFPTHDITNFYFSDYTECQIIKALLLFQFMDSTEEARTLLKRFCEYYGIANWKEYFERVIPTITAWAKRDKASSVDLIVEKDAGYEGNVGFLKKLALNNYLKLEDVDYIKLREKPLLQLDDVTYRIIHPLFVSDKIYKGIYFLLNQLNSQEPKIIKSFRSWYTSHFSEDVCFRDVIQYAIEKFSARYFDGELKEKGVVGPPDCYLRIDANLFLFENKDILINAHIKGGYDFEAVIKELKKKLYEEEGRPVGIGQIITNIRKLLTKENTFDKELLVEETYIYPILVIHDYMFDTPGLNKIMNILFQEELAKLQAEGLDVSRVKSFSIVNIDSLILAATLLRDGKTSLVELLDAFLSNAKFPKKEKYNSDEEYARDYQNSLLSFSNYIVHFLNKKFGPAWRSEAFMGYLYDKIK